MTIFIASPTIAASPADAIAMILLVALLALKVLIRSSEGQFFHTLNRLLSAGILPLLILFVVRVVPGLVEGLVQVF